jgi:DNA-binding response OmpR family regulator
MARIVVIDDDPAVQLSVQLMLEHDGHEVACAADGELGLKLITSNPPDLIITDIIMPNKDGMETIAEIRKTDRDTPILAISIGSHAQFLKMAEMLGANATLLKPFERQDLLAAVNKLLGLPFEQRAWPQRAFGTERPLV